jgi:hypothetical protein
MSERPAFSTENRNNTPIYSNEGLSRAKNIPHNTQIRKARVSGLYTHDWWYKYSKFLGHLVFI